MKTTRFITKSVVGFCGILLIFSAFVVPVAAQSTPPPTTKAILDAITALQTSVNNLQTSVNNISSTIGTLQDSVDNLPPAWYQVLPSAERFLLVMGDKAVLDRETGLVWQQNPIGIPLTWVGALSSLDAGGCMSAVTGERSGWRVPRVEEIATLAKPSNDLPAGHPFGSNAVGGFWTATTSTFDSSKAIVYPIGSSGGGGFGSFLKTESHLVWCVRTASPGFVGQ